MSGKFKAPIILSAVILIFLNLSCLIPIKDKRYGDILREIKSGNNDFAFMKLKDYLQNYPDNRHTQELKFALCEYYYEIKDYHDAIPALVDYINAYQNYQATIFAQALLYKIMLEYNQQPQLTAKIKENFFSSSLFLIFSESKVKHYNSLFKNKYKIAEYLDHIEIFKNNELLLKITP